MNFPTPIPYSKALLEVTDLAVYFSIRRTRHWFWRPKHHFLKAVDGISFAIFPGQTLGIVGESGCGKSTIARTLVGLTPATSGMALWDGDNLLQLTRQQRHRRRQEIQIIFQDPLSALDPRMTAGDAISEPLRNFYPQLSLTEQQARVRSVMDQVGLLPSLINRYPHEFSGGQCQRIGIARALISDPKLLICDESVSALDVSIQAQIVNLLKELQQERGLTLLFIAHDLAVVKYISDRVLVMYLGHVMEYGDSQEIYRNPLHPYTQALMLAVPIPDPRKQRAKSIQLLAGELPSPINPPSGCVFRTRCPNAIPECAITRPQLKGSYLHQVACLKVRQ